MTLHSLGLTNVMLHSLQVNKLEESLPQWGDGPQWLTMIHNNG